MNAADAAAVSLLQTEEEGDDTSLAGQAEMNKVDKVDNAVLGEHRGFHVNFAPDGDSNCNPLTVTVSEGAAVRLT